MRCGRAKSGTERFLSIPPLGILHFDEKGNIVSYNKQLLKILAATKRQLPGLNLLQSLRADAMQAAVEKRYRVRLAITKGIIVLFTVISSSR